MKFGKAELRIMLVQLSVWSLWFLAYILGAILISLVGGLLTVVFAPLGILVMIAGFIALLALLVYLPVKLAPAAALSISQNKTHILAARSVTKHRFWNLFLAYLVTTLFGYVGIYTIGALCMTLATGSADTIMALYGLGAENPRIALEAVSERMKNPFFLVIGIVALMLYLAVFNLWYLCLAGVGTYAVKWWSDELPSSSFD